MAQASLPYSSKTSSIRALSFRLFVSEEKLNSVHFSLNFNMYLLCVFVLCVPVLCVFVIEENMYVYFSMVMCELRCELGGGGVGGREGGKVVVAEYWISVAIPTHPTCL